MGAHIFSGLGSSIFPISEKLYNIKNALNQNSQL